MLNVEQETIVLEAVKAASERWQSAFNAGDAAGCADQYEANAVMHARPFGTFTGTREIQDFWQKLIDDGFTDVTYLEPRIELIDEKTAKLTSHWRMNQASGVIHEELWILQENGIAKLRKDDFEAVN